MKKRIICLLLSCLLLAACGSKNDWDSNMKSLDKPAGELISTTVVKGGFKYLFSNIEYNEAIVYIEYLKEEGYVLEPIYNASEITLIYNAKNKDGKDLEFMYNIKEKVATLTSTYKTNKSEEETESDLNEIANTVDWDSNNMGGLPAPEGFQFDQEIKSNYGWTVYFSKASIDEINTFITITTKNKYNLDINKEDSDGYYIYYTSYKDEDEDKPYDSELYIMYNIEAEGGYITVSD